MDGRTRSSRPEVFLGKGFLRISNKFTGKHRCQSVILIKLQSHFIKITLWHGCFPVNFCIFLEHFFLKTPLQGCFWRTTWLVLLSELLPKHQCAFRQGYEIHNCFLAVIERLRTVKDKEGIFAVILKDLSKAFHCISRNLFIAKLKEH